LAEDDLPDHAKVFGPIALEFDQYMLRRIGALPVIYIPQPFSTDPEHDRFALIGQSFVYRLFETYQILSDLAAISEHVETLPATDVQVTVRHSKADSEHYRYSSDMLRKLLRTLTHGKQPFPQLASAMCMLSCFFYPTDAPIAYRLQDDDGRLAYYREREWRIVSNINFRGVPIDKELGSEAASEIASVIDRSFSPYQDEMIHGTTFIHDCRLITTFDGDSIINAVRRILVPLELESQVGQLAQNYKYRGAVVGYSMPA